MISAEEREHFEQLRSQSVCPKKFACVEEALAALCRGEALAAADQMDCLRCRLRCKFARQLGSHITCDCPMRKYIADNFDKWTAETTSVLRQQLQIRTPEQVGEK